MTYTLFQLHGAVPEYFPQEKRKVSGTRPMFGQIPSPRQLKEFMDQYVIGQEAAKRAMAVAVHNHYKRLSHSDAGGTGRRTTSRSTRATCC